MVSSALSPADAAVLDAFVVPRYFALFAEVALELFMVGEGARVAHLGCRSGYPDVLLTERVPNTAVIGVDDSEPLLELARRKVPEGVAVDYFRQPAPYAELPGGSFSHVLMLHPEPEPEERAALFATAARLLYAGGQALIALPLRGSFQELFDLLREYAVKHDDGPLAEAVERTAARLPTIEMLSDQLESVGLSDVDVELRGTTLRFDSGRALMEDPVARLLLLPELRRALGVASAEPAVAYLRDAVDRYWSELELELGVNVGCASARRW